MNWSTLEATFPVDIIEIKMSVSLFTRLAFLATNFVSPATDLPFSASCSHIHTFHLETGDHERSIDIHLVYKEVTGGIDMNIVEVHNLEKSYGSNQVLRGLNFQAQAGEIIGVIGKNGAGKSTFLEILMTIKEFDEGHVVLFQKDIQKNNLEGIRKQISVVLQPTQFYKTLKVEELLKLFKAYYQSNVEVHQIIEDFQLEPHRKKYFDRLSGGWKQIVSLAIAFLSNPKLLILD